MISRSSLAPLALAFICIAHFAAAGEPLASTPLVTRAIDDRELVTLGGNTRPEATGGNDRGVVPDTLQLEHLQLQLQRSSEQEQEVAAYIAALHDRTSPNFQRWLSADEFGARFGASSADLDAIQGWLTKQGLKVNTVFPSRMVIDFSGTAGQVAAAFHTEIHRLEVNGATHMANVRDPQIPAALAPVLAGLVKLNDFRPARKHRQRPKFTGDCSGSPCILVTPADLATIYDFNPLFHGSHPITGKGQTIAVAEDTDLYSDADWTNFRHIFGLDGYRSGQLHTVHPTGPPGSARCKDPGVNADGDDVEAALDAEWSSAAAPDASILVVACDNSDTIDGVQQAIQYLIDGTTPHPPIISVSYGECEADNGAGLNAFFYHIYQQADAEGISVFVATGDEGPDDCGPADFSPPATYGVGVNAWASTPYNVAVGGTDFGDAYDGTTTKYWGKSTGAPWGTAKSYVPEIAWNDTCASSELTSYNGFSTSYGKHGFCNSSAGADYLELGGGEGGPSGCASGTPSIPNVVSGTCKGWPKPDYQKDIFGVPDDGVRDVPDVSMFAADGSSWGRQYALCFTDPNNLGFPCVGNPANWAQGGGGTSYATPIVAGIQALVNQKMGGPQGNPNPVYYRLAAREYGNTGNTSCDASHGPAGSSKCIFHDLTAGNDSQDCAGPVGCYRPGGKYGVMSSSDSEYRPTFETRPGYDYPSGIGTIDAANLVDAWDWCPPR